MPVCRHAPCTNSEAHASQPPPVSKREQAPLIRMPRHPTQGQHLCPYLVQSPKVNPPDAFDHTTRLNHRTWHTLGLITYKQDLAPQITEHRLKIVENSPDAAHSFANKAHLIPDIGRTQQGQHAVSG